MDRTQQRRRKTIITNQISRTNASGADIHISPNPLRYKRENKIGKKQVCCPSQNLKGLEIETCGRTAACILYPSLWMWTKQPLSSRPDCWGNSNTQKRLRMRWARQDPAVSRRTRERDSVPSLVPVGYHMVKCHPGAHANSALVSQRLPLPIPGKSVLPWLSQCWGSHSSAKENHFLEGLLISPLEVLHLSLCWLRANSLLCSSPTASKEFCCCSLLTPLSCLLIGCSTSEPALAIFSVLYI